MYDVMMDEARMWLDEPPQRKRKLEPPVDSPPVPVDEDSDDYVYASRKLEPPVYSPPVPVDEDSNEYVYTSEEDELDPVEEAKYLQQVRESDGFDVDFFYQPFGGIMPCGVNRSEILMGKVGLHCYNIDKGRNLQFRIVNKANAAAVSFVNYYITLEAMDPDNNNSLVTFQTCVWDSSTKKGERLRLITKQCRIKPQVPRNREQEASLWLWDPKAVDDFYTCEMPEWLQDDALAGDDKLQYHEVKESELRDNEWLYLYAEVALFSVQSGRDWSPYLPLEIKRVVVRTKEDVESSMKLKSSNVILYISFKTRGGIEWKGIIRQTRDGKPGHMCLEVNCWMDK